MTCLPNWTRSKRLDPARVGADRLGGLTVTLGDGCWFNLRPSSTGPLGRLNVEAPSRDAMNAIRDEVRALVRR